MSSAFSNRRLSPQDGRDILFCHTCGHEWYRSSEDTSPPPSCQRCQQDIVEIVTRENDPRTFQQTINSMFSDTLFNLGGLGSAGPSHRMPFLQHNHENSREHSRDNTRDNARDNTRNATLHSHMADDEDDFGHHFHDQLHRHFHDQIHARAHTQAMRNHHFGPGHGHDDEHNDDHDFNRGREHGDEEGLDSDPEEADIEEQEYHAPNNLYMYRTVTTNFGSSDRQQPQQSQAGSQQSGADTRRRPGGTEPSDAESVFQTFTHFLHGFDSQAGRSGPDTLFSNNGQSGIFGSARQTAASNNTTFGATSFTIATGSMRPGQAGGVTDFNTVLGNIMGNIGPPDIEEQNPRGAAGLPTGFPAALHQIILAVLSRDNNVQHGDAVHSDEALDRIITMLMESNQQSAGAPPASQNALDELERKRVDETMLGSEGHAECTICITEVELNEEVLLLPCKHWFHEECVVMWLKQHNTCPVCRNPVVQKDSENADRSSNSAAGPGSTAGGGNSASRNNAGSNAAGGGSGTPTNNGSNGSSIFGSALNNLPRGLFFNITGPSNHPGAAWGPGVADSEPSRSSNAPGVTGADPRANASTGTSSSAAPIPQMPSLRQRANAHERLNAIRSAAGLPSAAASANANANYYRSPRVPERSAAAERERRRRDSHSPNPGHNIPSRRYNSSFAPDFDDWSAAGLDFTTSRNSNWSAPTQNNSSRSHFWGAVGGTGSGSGAGASASRNGEQSSWDRRRSSIPRRDSLHGSDSASGSMNPPNFGRSSARQSRHSTFADPAPDTAMPGRPHGSWMPGSFSTQLGGDGHADADAQDEPRIDAGGHNQNQNQSQSQSRNQSQSQNQNYSHSHSHSHSHSRSNSNSSNNTNNGSAGHGGGGGLFGFFRRR